MVKNGLRRAVLPTLLIAARLAGAGEVDFPPLGPHYPVFTFEKNENPQNIMEIYAKVDPKCEFAPASADGPFIDFYWLMDGKRYKPVHSLIKSGIRDRLVVETPAAHAHEFSVRLDDLHELGADLKDPNVKVRASTKAAGCAVEAVMNFSNGTGGDIPVRLKRIYSEARKTIWPPFRKVVSVTLEGTNLRTGAAETRTYKAR